MGLWGLSLATAPCHLSGSLLGCAGWPGFLCPDSPPLPLLWHPVPEVSPPSSWQPLPEASFPCIPGGQTPHVLALLLLLGLAVQQHSQKVPVSVLQSSQLCPIPTSVSLPGYTAPLTGLPLNGWQSSQDSSPLLSFLPSCQDNVPFPMLILSWMKKGKSSLMRRCHVKSTGLASGSPGEKPEPVFQLSDLSFTHL